MALPDPKAKLHLQGQDSADAKELVAQQRELKKRKDAVRKLLSKLKATNDDAQKIVIQAEIDEHQTAIDVLEPPPPPQKPEKSEAEPAAAPLPDPKAKLHLQGQDSVDAKEQVAQQRELKKRKDAIRKLTSKLKNTTDEGEKAAIQAEIDENQVALLALEPAPASQPQELNEAAPAAPTPALPTSSSAPDSKAKLHLQGQDNADAKEQVAQQREIKKRKDAARKLVSKLKAATDESQKAAIQAEIDENNAALAALESAPQEQPHQETQPAADSKLAQPRAAESQTLPPLGASSAKHVPAPVGSSTEQQTAQPKRSFLSMTLLRDTLNNRVALATPITQGPTSAESSFATSTAVTPSRPTSSSNLVFKPQTQQVSPTLSMNVKDGRASETLVKYSSLIHPRFAELGLLMQDMQLVGGNARTIALLDAFSVMAKTTPVLNVPTFNSKERKEFEKLVQDNFKFVANCREPCASMSYVKNALLRRLQSASQPSPSTSIRRETMPQRHSSSTNMFDAPSSPTTAVAPSAFHSRSLPASTSRFHVDPIDIAVEAASNNNAGDRDFSGTVADHIVGIIDEIREEIFRSIHSLVEERAQSQVSSGDCILTYGRSSSVELVLQHAVALNKKIRVIVVDDGPLHEGKGLASRLQRIGVEVTYGLITSLCTLLPKCNKVFIGASAVLQSGEVYSRAGTAMVAACANRFRKPVLCLCETHKFVPKVWIGSLVQNSEVGDLWQRRPMGCQSQQIPILPEEGLPSTRSRLNPSGYLYDLTPAVYVDMIVCEMGCLHTSAIAAAIRDRQDRELLMWQP